MPESLHRPYKLKKTDKEVENLIEKINGIWVANNPKDHQFIQFDCYILLKAHIDQPDLVTVKKYVRKKKDHLQGFPPDHVETIKELKIGCGLKVNEIETLKKLTKNAEFQLLKLEQQIEKLTNQAKGMATAREQKNQIENIRKCSKNLSESLASVPHLDYESKLKVKEKLEEVNEDISQAYRYID